MLNWLHNKKLLEEAMALAKQAEDIRGKVEYIRVKEFNPEDREYVEEIAKVAGNQYLIFLITRLKIDLMKARYRDDKAHDVYRGVCLVENELQINAEKHRKIVEALKNG
jgi:DNA-binding GntR family transcriptional regulator